MMHRPLSEWVIALRWPAGGTARWSPSVDVNYGDERSDARALPEFGDGWQRRAIPMDGDYLALGLVRTGSGEAVIEVDNHARPVRVAAAAITVIERLEESWPDADLTDTELAILASQSEVVRYLLAGRLAAEGSPPANLFHILPWDRVDQLAGQLTDMLNGAEPPTGIIELRHWFTPVGSRFTAALEQLDEGIRDQDHALRRLAATALCTRLLQADLDLDRLPEQTRIALAGLAESLDRVDPFLKFAARRAAARLTPGASAAETRPGRLSTQLPPAAETATTVREESVRTVREPFTLELKVTAAGRAEVTVSAPLTAELRSQVADSYGVMLLPVLVRGEGISTRYVLPMRLSGGRLSGQLKRQVPPGRFVEADVDGPPVGATEAAFLEPEDVRRSIRVIRTGSGLRPWDRVAELLPETHALRTLITAEIARGTE